MGDVGEELGLEAVELLETVVGPFEVGLGLLEGEAAADLLAMKAVQDDLAGAGNHGRRDEEGEVGE